MIWAKSSSARSARAMVAPNSTAASESEICDTLDITFDKSVLCALIVPLMASMLFMMLRKASRFSVTIESSWVLVDSSDFTVRSMPSNAAGNPSVASASNTALRFSRMSSTPSMSWSVLFFSGMSSTRTASAMPTSMSLTRVSPGSAKTGASPAISSMDFVPKRSFEVILARVSFGIRKFSCTKSNDTISEPFPSAENAMSVTCPTLNPLTSTGFETARPSTFSYTA